MVKTTPLPDITVQLVLDVCCDLGESPVWDEATGTLYFVDINKHLLHALKPDSGEHSVVIMNEPLGCVVPTTHLGTVLVARKRDIVEVQVSNKAIMRTVATVPDEHDVGNMRFNDGKATPHGALLVGRMHSAWRDGNRGRVYRLDPGASSSTLVEVMTEEEVHLPNGMAWDPRRRNLYFVDSGSETITEYQTDHLGAPRRNADGKLEGRVAMDLGSGGKTPPDGMAIDSGGNLWVALGESGTVACYDPRTGKVLHRVPLPVKRPTACAFGGASLEDLFVTTRVETGPDASPHHGGLFKINVPGIKGMAPSYCFDLDAP